VDTPIDLSALKKLNASGEAKIGWLKLANVKTQNVNIGLKAADGIATISPFAANLYQGSMDGLLRVDARGTPSITFKQDMKNIAIGPLLVDAINNDMLDGKGTLNIDVTTSGNTVSALKKALAGKAAVNLADGAIKGIDIPGTLRDIKSKVALFQDKSSIGADDKKKTDFSELSASFDIKNGVAHNEDLAMKAPILRLAKGDSRGDIDIGNETINYLAKPTIVKSLKGQGGADLDSLAGLSIPVKITGTFSAPKYGMDFAAIGAAMAKSNLLDKVGGEKGAAVKELIGDGDKTKALESLLGKKKAADPATAPATNDGATSNTAPAPAQAPKSTEDAAKEKAAEELKKLFKF
jgi:AsmA protein